MSEDTGNGSRADLVDQLSADEVLDVLDSSPWPPASCETRGGVPFRMLSDLLDTPGLVQPPVCVLPRLAWSGRVSLLAAQFKDGKTTLVAQGVAAKTTGRPFLGDNCPRWPVVWVAIDEPLADTVQKLAHFGARDCIAVVERDPDRPLTLLGLQEVIREVDADLVIIDCLSEWVQGLIDNENDASQWVPHLRGFRQLAQETEAGILLLHQANRGSGTFRGSSAIGAGVDAVIEMHRTETDSTVRRLDSRGRVVSEEFRIRYDSRGGFALDTGELSMSAKVLAAIVAHPGSSAAAIVRNAKVRKADVLATIQQLLAERVIIDTGTGEAHAYRTA